MAPGNSLFSSESHNPEEWEWGYTPRPPREFAPERVILAKGSNATAARRELAERICAAYPQARVEEAFDRPHNRIDLNESDPLRLHSAGKRTLVLAEHNSGLRHSTEDGNSCPNYWHFSPYGFCPYGCTYCYLAGTQGVRFSPTVKIFLNLPEMLAEIDVVARRLGTETPFYLGKLQDGLALDPLTGYSRIIVPFFASHPLARLTLLTKSSDVENLIDLDHRQHSILSWTLNPPAVGEMFETNVPLVEDRLAALERCSRAGYPVRAVVMPIVPIAGWESIYREFLIDLVGRVRLRRITFGSICSYPQAIRLMEQKIGASNPISVHFERNRGQAGDGRTRFPIELREKVYRHLLQTVQEAAPGLEIGLCLEDPSMFGRLGLHGSTGRCNCVL
jgi:spore photoproduct lyase